ncbi:Phosphoserine phosphatase [Fulvivirga imtechensis AK7]|uniref:Phosphoserine phosphatase n=1 Tax=Fulvivirga imtechensis AK7 TaxID=1237149 RepID=L8JWD6_9BACT|nr:HAD-IB family hydrolase [Fulvivirga imtechensis]ELR73346.1 Phosphoserine phosphatase [Fulvivirga imtechensis AK7]
MKKLALFDFDGTLTTRDTLLEFIKFYRGTFRFYLGFLILSPLLILYKLKIIPNWKAKEYTLQYFFKGESLETFNQKAHSFALNRIPAMLRKKAMDKLQWHLKNGHEVAVVSASAVNWIKPWVEKLNIGLIATELEVKNGLLTGRISGKNCYGNEKVTRVCAKLVIDDFTEIYAYGDSSGDKELLDLATHPFYRSF